MILRDALHAASDAKTFHRKQREGRAKNSKGDAANWSAASSTANCTTRATFTSLLLDRNFFTRLIATSGAKIFEKDFHKPNFFVLA